MELLERARAGGANVSSLTLAQCYWRLDRTTEAEREFRRALERRDAPSHYLELCLQALANPPGG